MKHIKTNNFLHGCGCGFEMSNVKYLYIMKAKNTLSAANQLVCKCSLIRPRAMPKAQEVVCY